MTTYTLKTYGCLFLIVCLITSCSKDDEILDLDDYMPTKTEQYFLDVALTSEFGEQNNRLKKWDSDLLIFVDHNGETELLNELDRIVEEINSLSQSIELRIIQNREAANFILLLGTGEEYAALEQNAANLVNDNWGLTWIYWNSNSIITRGSMYVDIIRNMDIDCQKHLLREELTQSLGLLNDTYDFPGSIFYQEWTCTTEYSAEDRMLISYLLDPAFEANMMFSEILNIFSMN